MPLRATSVGSLNEGASILMGSGRKKQEIDWKKVDLMLEAHCLGTEVANHLGIHPDTLYNRVKEEFKVDFSAYSRQKKEKGKSHVKVKQYQEARIGNKQMLIWLGKNWLGQKDEPKKDQEFDGSLAQLLQLLKSLKSYKEFEKKDKEKDESTPS